MHRGFFRKNRRPEKYPLFWVFLQSLVSAPMCTRCGSPLPMRALWAFARASDRSALFQWLGRSGLFQTKVGVVCPKCGARFRVVQTRTRIFRVICWGALFGTLWLLGGWLRSRHFTFGLEVAALLLVVVVAFQLAVERFTPHFAQVRPVGDEEIVGFPLYSAYERTEENEP